MPGCMFACPYGVSPLGQLGQLGLDVAETLANQAGTSFSPKVIASSRSRLLSVSKRAVHAHVTLSCLIARV